MDHNHKTTIMAHNETVRVLGIQYAGDYRKAYKALSSGKGETYYAQKYCVDAVTDLAQQIEQVSWVCCMSSEPYEEVLDNGVRAIGAGFQNGVMDISQLIDIIEAQNPTHIITDTANRKLLKWATQRQIKTVVMLSNSIMAKGLRGKVKGFLLAQTLNHPGIDWVCSYGLTSSLTLQQIGVNPAKIIPWDFLIGATPGEFPPKLRRASAPLPQLIYVGSLVDGKGVSDLMESVALLHQRQMPVRLAIVGQDGAGVYSQLANKLQISDSVDFLGTLMPEQVTLAMHESDVVVVPSRHDYPEGFPLVIHHALCAQTPLVVSDHPMFQLYLKHQVNAMMFAGQDTTDMANQIVSLLSDAPLYQQLSEASHPTWYQMRLPVKWADVINQWLLAGKTSDHWFGEHSLTSGRYTVP
jgi:glycosyltransferase involved in cell wall biosynthesis